MAQEQNPSRSAGPVVPGLISLAITASFISIPLVGSFLIFLLPAPLAYIRYRQGAPGFLAVSALCVALMGFSAGGGIPAFMVAGLCLAGYLLGGSLKSGERMDRAVLMATVIPLLALAAGLGASFAAAGVNPWSLLRQGLEGSLAESARIYAQMGMSKADIAAVMPSLRLFVRVVEDYFTAIAVDFAATVAAADYIIVRSRLERLGVLDKRPGEMSGWTVPDLAVWGIIVPGFMMLVPVDAVRLVGGNLVAISAMVFFFQGMAVALHLFERLRLSTLLRVFVFALMFIQPFLLAGLAGIGLFDVWLDFRKIRAPRKP